jgi:lambda repressor-like predicted transcriptional regulator
MTYKNIVKLIKKEYDKQGHSVRSLSIKADVARQSVNRILSGEGVTVSTLIAVCGVLGLDVDVKKMEK